MDAKQLLLFAASLVAASLCGQAVAEETRVPYAQVAEIEIDPTQLEAYKAAVNEQIETAIRVEPGVLVLYAVADKDSPTRVRVFEISRSPFPQGIQRRRRRLANAQRGIRFGSAPGPRRPRRRREWSIDLEPVPKAGAPLLE